MNLPLFSVRDDPGPDFNRLLASSGVAPSPIDGALDPRDYRHGTTCVAIRFADGVLLAGDRRATSGNLISHRTLEKVFPADRHSGVAIAGAAGPAIEMVKLFKIESAGVATKMRALLEAGGDAIEGPFDGEEAITLLADLDAGATGSMTSGLIPDLIRPVITAHAAGDRDAAVAGYTRVLPVINHENRQCGFRAAKAAMVEGGVIKSDFCRHPIDPLPAPTREELLGLMRPLDPIVLRWGH